MPTNFGLYNVVVYDGKDAYVMEFILEQSRSINTPTVRALNLLETYIKGNGKLLYTDHQYNVTLDSLETIKKDSMDVYERFNNMYFC